MHYLIVKFLKSRTLENAKKKERLYDADFVLPLDVKDFKSFKAKFIKPPLEVDWADDTLDTN